jgi:hypothetical protein
LENSHIKFLLDSEHVTFYSRYVDDIFIIYNATCTNPDTITPYANSIHNSLQLTPTLETNKHISYLDLLITRTPSQIEIDIYRKPTLTNTTINYLFNHPTEHKLAAYRYYIERMLNLPVNNDQQDRE